MTQPQGDLQDWARALVASNPFRGNRVSDPRDVDVDVEKIHDREFRRILRAAHTVRTGQSSVGLMLLGPSGVGKSHLLGRLYSWARQQGGVGYVFLHNLQSSPERMPRYLLKATVSSLCTYRRGGPGTATLYSLLLSALPAGAEQMPIDQRIREMSGDSRSALDRAIFGVLVGFMEALKAVDAGNDSRELVEAAVEWLSGDLIDEDHAQLLSNLSGESIAPSLPDNHAVERAFIVLSLLLARDGKSLILCLDQIDNLDAEQVAALASFLHALIDHSNNLLVICSGVTSSIEKLRDQRVIPEAAWDRLGEERVDLHEIGTAEARSIVAGRCERFGAPFAELREVAEQRARDGLFPLEEGWWRARIGDALQVRPRDAVSWARREWESLQDVLDTEGVEAWLATRAENRPQDAAKQEAPDGSQLEHSLDERVLAKLQELVAQRKLEPASLPPDADNLVTLTRILLAECAGREDYSLISLGDETPEGRSAARPFDLIATERNRSGAEVRTGVLFLMAAHGNSVTAALRRLVDEPAPPDHVLLVTDERRRFKLGARGQQHLDSLLQRGSQHFQHLRLSLEAYSELDALVGLLRQARVGDFEISEGDGFRAVSEREVADTYHRLGRFRSHALLHDLVTEDVASLVPPAPAPPLDPATVREAICGLLSWKTSAGALELAQKLSEDFGVVRDEALLRQVIDVADQLHDEGIVRSTPQENDRYLLWLGEQPS